MFEARVRTSNSFVLFWHRPENEDLNGIITGYDLGFQTGKERNFVFVTMRNYRSL